MKKRTLAILMALALLISLVPLTAMAEECEHEWRKGFVYQGNATHAVVCQKCGDIQDGSICPCDDTFTPGTCFWCKGSLTPVEPEEPACEHELHGVVNNGENHDVVCRDCSTVLKENVEHEYNEYDTCACGAVKPHECTFEAGVTSNEDGTHNINCECGEYVTVKCLDNDGDGKCDSCGYVKYVHECDFAAGVTSNEDGTHNINCECGEYVTVKCLDNDGDAECDSCGYVKYCKHEWHGVVNKGESHDLVCRDCSAVLKENVEHEYNEYDTCACGAVKSHKCTFEASVTSNEDGTHNINCECGEYVTVKCLDPNGDGDCDSCGYELYPTVNEDPEETKPEETEPEVTEPEATKPEETEPEVTEPEVTEPEETQPEEENESADAPQTGDTAPMAALIAVMLLCVAAMIALMGIKLHNKAIRR